MGSTGHEKGDVLANAQVWKVATRTVKAGLAEPLATREARGVLNAPKAQFVLKPALVKPSDVIGKIEARQGDKVLKQADVVAPEFVEQGGYFSRVWDSIRLFFRGLFG